jgi:MATE family multidrug resistance protein
VHETRRVVALAAPVVAAQLGIMLLGFVDLLMVGHLEGRDGIQGLGAVSLGRLWVMSTLIVGMGTIFGMDPIVSQARGARDSRTMGLALQRGLIVAGLVSVPVGLLWLATEPVLLLLGQSPELSALAHHYVVVQLPSLPLFLFFVAGRQWLQGRGIVLPAMWVILLANLLNVAANWALIFGHLGLPALGVLGAGAATALTQASMLFGLAVWGSLFRLQRGAWLGWTRDAWSASGVAEMLHYGWPVAVQLGLEMWAFQAATVMAGSLGDIPLAAHTIVLNLTSLSFMVPLGIALGATTRVGNLIGSGNPHAAQRSAWVALGLGAAVMSVSATVFIAGQHLLPSLYTLDPVVTQLAAAVLPVAAAFQLVDGVQVVGGGVLRGMGRTRPAALFNLLGYYAFALPVGWWLAFYRGHGLAGVWWGLASGLFVVSALLVAWIAKRGPAHVDARIRS